jgi:hypothetical protein
VPTSAAPLRTLAALALATLVPAAAHASGLAPGIVTADGELVLTLGRSTAWPVVALVDAHDRLRGVLHRQNDPGAVTARLAVVDENGRRRIVLGSFTSIDGKVRCRRCLAFLDADERPRAVLEDTRLALYDPDGNETQALDAGDGKMAVLQDAKGTVRGRSKRGAVLLVDERGAVLAQAGEDAAGPFVTAGPARLGAEGEFDPASVPAALRRETGRLLFSDRKARDKEIPVVRWEAPVLDFPEAPLQAKKANVAGGQALRVESARAR